MDLKAWLRNWKSWIGNKERGNGMERYELANGDVYELIFFTDDCVVAKNGNIVHSGSYVECRRYIEAMREIARLKGM